MRLQHESFVYIVNLCRVKVANYSRTSLRLSHPSEIGALDEPYMSQISATSHAGEKPMSRNDTDKVVPLYVYI